MLDGQQAGERVRRLRRACGLGQVEFAERVGIANGSVSKIENGRLPLTDDLLAAIAQVVDCSPAFLRASSPTFPPSRPWLRAYADASKRDVDRQLADASLATEVIELLDLKTMPDALPVFDGDPDDSDAIEHFAVEVRAAAQIADGDVVGNSIRAAERLGCLVLPMGNELGRHLGMSMRANLMPVVCVSRSGHTGVPGDRQRHTVAHELGHLTLHGRLGPPETSEEAARIERQAHLFAGAFLTPGDPLLDDLAEYGGRVTLRTLSFLKERWGVAIKALVMRFRALGVIDADHARSLYKQISARGWSTDEPVSVGSEDAIWLSKAIAKKMQVPDFIGAAAQTVG